MKKEICKCAKCKNGKVIEDKNWIRHQCPFSPDKEYLSGWGEEPLVRNCKNYEPKYDWLKENKDVR